MMIVGRQEGFADPETLVQKLNDVVANNEAFVVAARADRAERDMNQAIREEQDAAFQETLRQVTLEFQIEDTARKNLTRLKKGINFWFRVTVIWPKHRGN